MQSDRLRRVNLRDFTMPYSRLRPLFVGTDMQQINDLRGLSLTARLAVALLCFERYCHAHQLIAPEITLFLDYLWEFPILDGSSAFQAWESRQPDLVTVGLGGDFPDTYLAWLDAARIKTSEFRQLLKHTVEIVYGSFYAAAADEEALIHLQEVLMISKQTTRIAPLLSHFVHSRFDDHQGWGNRVSAAERDGWRALSK
jgi:hypothetical protein